MPLKLKWGWKLLLAALLAVAAFKFHLLHLFGGPMFFSPVCRKRSAGGRVAVLRSFPVLFPAAGGGCGAGSVSAGFVLLAEEQDGKVPHHWQPGECCFAGFSAVLATVGMIGGTRVPQVKEETVAVNRLPEEADGLTVAVLADLHVDGITREERIRKIVERTNALNPDIVVIAGDFVDGTVPVHGGDLRPLADLKARYGVFGVPGNHEYYSGYEEWMEFLPTLGIRMLLNEHAPAGGEAVVLAGVTDPVAGIMGKEEPDISKALKDAPERECASLFPTSRGWPGKRLRTAWIFKCPAIRTEA